MLFLIDLVPSVMCRETSNPVLRQRTRKVKQASAGYFEYYFFVQNANHQKSHIEF